MEPALKKVISWHTRWSIKSHDFLYTRGVRTEELKILFIVFNSTEVKTENSKKRKLEMGEFLNLLHMYVPYYCANPALAVGRVFSSHRFWWVEGTEITLCSDIISHNWISHFSTCQSAKHDIKIDRRLRRSDVRTAVHDRFIGGGKVHRHHPLNHCLFLSWWEDLSNFGGRIRGDSLLWKTIWRKKS